MCIRSMSTIPLPYLELWGNQALSCGFKLSFVFHETKQLIWTWVVWDGLIPPSRLTCPLLLSYDMISCLCGTRDPRELTFFQCWNRARASPPGVTCQISCHEVKLFQLPGQSDSAGFLARSGHTVKAYDGICYRMDLEVFVLKIAFCNQNSFHSVRISGGNQGSSGDIPDRNKLSTGLSQGATQESPAAKSCGNTGGTFFRRHVCICWLYYAWVGQKTLILLEILTTDQDEFNWNLT